VTHTKQQKISSPQGPWI